MKVKKVILWIAFLLPAITHPVLIRQTLTSVTEQKVLGKNFKHVIMSGKREREQYFIDGKGVDHLVYQEQLEYALRKEYEDQVLRQQQAARSRLEFADATQLEIISKLLRNIVDDIDVHIKNIENPALIKFYVYNTHTVENHDQLQNLQKFIAELEDVIESKTDTYDIEGLHLVYAKLEVWPARLEKFFQDTVRYAIKKSDDTVMLKELLKMVSEIA